MNMITEDLHPLHTTEDVIIVLFIKLKLKIFIINN